MPKRHSQGYETGPRAARFVAECAIDADDARMLSRDARAHRRAPRTVAAGVSGVHIALPTSRLLTLNQRLHWRVKAERTAELRTIARLAARAARLPAVDRAHIVATVTWPDRRRRDVGNVAPTVKALVDGLVDAGVLPDDDDKHLTGPDLRVAPEPGPSGWVAFWIDIDEREAVDR